MPSPSSSMGSGTSPVGMRVRHGAGRAGLWVGEGSSPRGPRPSPGALPGQSGESKAGTVGVRSGAGAAAGATGSGFAATSFAASSPTPGDSHPNAAARAAAIKRSRRPRMISESLMSFVDPLGPRLPNWLAARQRMGCARYAPGPCERKTYICNLRHFVEVGYAAPDVYDEAGDPIRRSAGGPGE